MKRSYASTLHKCPHCNGQGHVNKPSYVAGDQDSWVSSSTATTGCWTCSGRGYIVVPTEQTKLKGER